MPCLAMADGKKALNLLEKQEYDKLTSHLDKSIQKDSLNPGAYYVYSLLFLDSAFSRFDIDTSYLFINLAIVQVDTLDEKSLKKLSKAEITDSTMRAQKSLVEAAAYQRARQQHSLESYNYFLRNFLRATETDSAIYHRNAIAYQKAVDENTYQAFQAFMETYPNAIQYPDAKTNYERLLFRSKTEDGSLKTYIEFLKINPETPHRAEVEKNILEIATASNSLNSYRWFIESYPNSTWRKRAFDFLYHSYKSRPGAADFLQAFSNYFISDSLRSIVRADRQTLFPVYEEGRYGFVDGNGKFLIPFQYDSLNLELLCGNIEKDYLEVMLSGKKQIVSRLGNLLYQGNYEDLDDIGSGLLKIKRRGKYGLIHKSGEPLLDYAYDDIELLGHAYLKVKKAGKWGLMSVMGRKVLAAEYDDIEREGNFILIKKEKYYAVQNTDNLNKSVEGEAVSLFFSFDDYLLMDDNHLLVFAGENETLVNKDLNNVSQTQPQKIYRYFGGWYVKTTEGHRILDYQYRPVSDAVFADIQKDNKKLAIKAGNKWAIYYRDRAFPEKFEYDSVRFLGANISIIIQGDKTFATFQSDTLVDISGSEEIRLLKPQGLPADPGSEMLEYLLTKSKRGDYTAYDSRGAKALSGRFDAVEALGREYFVVTRNGKKGLYHVSGKELLKSSYQGISNYVDGYVSTFLHNKFGMYNYNRKELIMSAKHDKLLRIYNDQYFLSEKEGKSAFVNPDNDIISEYAFEAIEKWTDTVALVKTNEHWALYDIKNKKFIFEKIERVEWLQKEGNEKLLFITKNGQKGVLSNISGHVVSPTFNDVYNIGTASNPVFFAEKYIHEAEFYIVIYYSKKGEIIRKQVFTDDEYWKVYCE